MGNENSRELDLLQHNGSIQDKHENGGVNGISITIKANGYTVDVPTPTDQSVDPPGDETDTGAENAKIQEEKENVNTANGHTVNVPAKTTAEETIQQSTEYAVLEVLNEAAETPETSAETEQDKDKDKDKDNDKDKKVSVFSKMFRKKSTRVKKQTETPPEESSEDQSPPEIQHQEIPAEESVDPPPSPEVRSEPSEYVLVESAEEVPQTEQKVSVFSKMFKKKTTAKTTTTQEERQPDTQGDQTDTQGDQTATQGDQTDTQPQLEADHLKKELPEREAVEDGKTEGTEEEPDLDKKNILEDSLDTTEDHPVMNFFKTLVAPKTSKKEAPAADATKDQPQSSESHPPAAAPTTTTTVAQVLDPPAPPKGMPAPPPPPPEPPKLDIKAEPGAKATPKEEPKTAAKDSPKIKSAKDTLTRLFRPKTKTEKPETVEVDAPTVVEDQEETLVDVEEPVVEEKETADIPQTVTEDQKTDASKSATLEAAAKPDVTPAVQEERSETKTSFLSFFKPTKAKAGPVPAAAAEVGPVKEEVPKAAKSEAPAEAKPVTATPSGGEDVATAPKKLEKRNSITLFFKNLSQKRPSTDATAEGAPAPSSEKTK